MCTRNFLILITSRKAGIILLIALITGSCRPPPIVFTASAAPTELPTTIAPPSPTSLPLTSTSEPPVLVTSLEEILGEWLTRCGGGPCAFEIRADGTYSQRYINPTLGGGITQIDRGKIAFVDGVFHLESTSGYCERMPNGFYRAFLTHIGERLYLSFEGTQKDECAERQSSISREMKFMDD